MMQRAKNTYIRTLHGEHDGRSPSNPRVSARHNRLFAHELDR